MGLLGMRRRRHPDPPPGPLADLAAAEPFDRRTPLEDVELVALDLETTGLDPARHELLSFGWVPVLAGQVRLAGARHRPVRPRGEVGESAVVHGLTDDALASAPPLAETLPEVLAAFTGGRRRVLLAHFAQVETTFLTAACRQVYGSAVDLQVVDTLEVQRRLMRAQHHELRPGTLRLDACRRRHNLPRYGAHNATTDAIAAGELFLAQCSALEVARGRRLTLDDVLERD
ncbi:exonuclease domain-containing protein [Ornithinimicrobium panacihumi]|uniref:exonuclease domain-containing protein n=1 Tax=Ornithinimicrobium panacihumi TaxID=2008449 RepID=UPI003F8B63E5